MRVRTYGFPEFFNEANPESSTRYTGTSSPTSKLVRPLCNCPTRVAPKAIRDPFLVPLGHRALDLAPRVALLDRAALVVQVLALRHRELDLGPRPVPVEARGHDRQALLRGRAEQPLDLAAVQQQLPRTLGVVVLARRLVGRDVHVAQPYLAVLDV